MVTEKSGSEKLPIASEPCLAWFTSSQVIRHGALKECESLEGWALRECSCRLRVWKLSWCYSPMGAYCSEVKVVLFGAGTSPHFLGSALGKIVLQTSALLTSDNHFIPYDSTYHLPSERAITRFLLLAWDIRQHSSGFIRQHQNPFPHPRIARFAASCKSLALTARLVIKSKHTFPIPEGRLEQHYSSRKKTEGRRKRGISL